MYLDKPKWDPCTYILQMALCQKPVHLCAVFNALGTQCNLQDWIVLWPAWILHYSKELKMSSRSLKHLSTVLIFIGNPMKI